jgi:hypothetical protein
MTSTTPLQLNPDEMAAMVRMLGLLSTDPTDPTDESKDELVGVAASINKGYAGRSASHAGGAAEASTGSRSNHVYTLDATRPKLKSNIWANGHAHRVTKISVHDLDGMPGLIDPFDDDCSSDDGDDTPESVDASDSDSVSDSEDKQNP